MSFLHDELAKFKAAAGEAFNFADPEAYVKLKADQFHEAVVNKVAELEKRIEALEPAKAPAVDAVTAGLAAATAAVAAPSA
jgi:hypothetical protein